MESTGKTNTHTHTHTHTHTATTAVVTWAKVHEHNKRSVSPLTINGNVVTTVCIWAEIHYAHTAKATHNTVYSIL